MRQFTFTVRFTAGADALMDVFIDERTLQARSRACFAYRGSMWRIDLITGPPETLSTVDDRYLDETTCNECLDIERCDSHREYHVLDRGRDYRIIYSRRYDIGPCHSIPSLAVAEIGDGVILEARRHQDAYRWLVLMPEAASVGSLYDRIESDLREGLSLELDQLRSVDGGNRESVTLVSPAEEMVLREAVDAGYYATPRETTIASLAESIDIPRSTVQYRLQRAEEKIVRRFVIGDSDEMLGHVPGLV